MSFSRVPKPTKRTEDGLYFPAEIEVVSPATVTDSLLARLIGNKIDLRLDNIDPATRVARFCTIEMSRADTDHLIGVLSRLRAQLKAGGE